jgi:uncharacterized protein (DUF1800 family)
MNNDPRVTAALGLHRFGLGPRGNAIRDIQSDPRGALRAELDEPRSASQHTLITSAQAYRNHIEFNFHRTAQQTLETRRKERPSANEPSFITASLKLRAPGEILNDEIAHRISAAFESRLGFFERLTWFWSNHFCIFAPKVLSMAGGYEREAIRPNVTGRFAEMLQAVESHPAMLVYLDNTQNFGPASAAGINASKGINENLAREILELHTLGVDGGYTQSDVTSFAYALTGWTHAPVTGDTERGGEFVFMPRMHEEKPRTVLGKAYDQPGAEKGRAILRDLSRHPATAKHIAFKFARHFVADVPPQALVDQLARNFVDTEGDLKQLARTLIGSDEAWTTARPKLKSPAEWIMSAIRTVGVLRPLPRVARAHVVLGQPLWSPPAPAGFSDHAAAWIDGMGVRLNLATAFAQMWAGEGNEARGIVEQALGPLASRDTIETVARAESRHQAMTMLLMSPEFQRR